MSLCLPLFALSAANNLYGTTPWPCVQCMAVQDALRRAIMGYANEGGDWKADLADIIAGVCKSAAWKDSEYSDKIRKGCSNRVKEHAEVIGQWWSIVKDEEMLNKQERMRWMMASICTQPRTQACEGRDLSWIDALDRKMSRCDLCRAIAKDAYAITKMSKHQPHAQDDEAYGKLKPKLDAVCENFGLWRKITAADAEYVDSECKIMFQDHSSRIDTLLLNTTAAYARSFCKTEMHMCQFDMALLPYADDGLNLGSKKEEL